MNATEAKIAISSVTRGYWLKEENQQKFLNDLAKRLQIKTPNDWGKLSVRRIKDLGGSSLLSLNGNSLKRTLRSVFKGFIRTYVVSLERYKVGR